MATQQISASENQSNVKQFAFAAGTQVALKGKKKVLGSVKAPKRKPR